jgi:putative nucleotidyltransferase with HDIG domain
MRRLRTFLHSRVARRVFVDFLVCALAPVAALTALASVAVERHLRDQTATRLQRSAKIEAMAVLERLRVAEEELRAVAASLTLTPGRLPALRAPANSRLRAAHIYADGRLEDARGAPLPAFPSLTEGEVRHLGVGRALLRIDPAAPAAAVIMMLALRPEQPTDTLLVAVIDDARLAGAESAGLPVESGPSGLSACILAEGVPGPIVCRGDGAERGTALLARRPDRETEDLLEWRDAGGDVLGAAWILFLGFDYAAGAWRVVVGEPKDALFGVLHPFRRTFLIAALLAIAFVVLLATRRIRRTTEPLDALTEGTARLARQDFSRPVAVRSGDEFDLLAASFNGMAERIQQHVSTLAALNAIDQAGLTERSSTKLLEALGTTLARGLPECTLAVATPDLAGERWIRCLARGPDGKVLIEDAASPPAPILERLRSGQPLRLAGSEVAGSLLPAGGADGCWILPLSSRGELHGLVTIALETDRPQAADWLDRARRFADQTALSLSNTRLLERLEDLHWGTLSALARTIDANSPWTAGHSERVTTMSVDLGREMGLDPAQLEVLRRGGLLHDIGKIGVPGAILDKPGRLDPSEEAIVRAHPVTGVTILAPIRAYAEILPIVRSHHERWDGLGYPEHLVGEAIPPHARIVAVADVFDAVTSDRPYRRAWSVEEAAALIEVGAGAHFDPVVVDVFLRLLRSRQSAAGLPSAAAGIDSGLLTPAGYPS